MKQAHLVLFWISLDFMSGAKRLREVISEIQEIGEVIGSSSIYKKFLNQRSEDLNSELGVVVKVGTERTQQEVFEFLRYKFKLKQPPRNSAGETLILLAFDQDVRLFPGENLPSPRLHSDPLTLRCAAEAWGGYEHPVLKQTLNELVRSSVPLPQVEFFAQGKILF